MQKLRTFAQSLGLANLNENLLRLALTHSSYVNDYPLEQDNERLEFLGDAVLSILSSELLYAKFRGFREGQLSRIRANLVCEDTLVRVAYIIGLPQVMRLGKSAAGSGGYTRPSILAGCVEALLGAAYLEEGLESARELFERLYATIIPEVSEEWSEADPKSALQEMAPEAVSYSMVEESGPDHNRRYKTEVSVSGQVLGIGEGRSKKHSEQAAARIALQKLRQ
ncbi:MAG: ribonuclease III [Bacillota bacterium]|nr:MAG: ribonuclease III [Bacillota bacterium]